MVCLVSLGKKVFFFGGGGGGVPTGNYPDMIVCYGCYLKKTLLTRNGKGKVHTKAYIYLLSPHPHLD